MTKLGKALRFGTTLTIALAISTQAWASRACRHEREHVALKAAAIQQRLMVAALTCHQTRLYNRFVISYRTDLRHSDTELKHYFAHRGGMSAYHAYKTKLANDASLASLHDSAYCAKASDMFGTASEYERRSLTEFVAAVVPGIDTHACHGTRVASSEED